MQVCIRSYMAAIKALWPFVMFQLATNLVASGKGRGSKRGTTQSRVETLTAKLLKSQVFRMATLSEFYCAATGEGEHTIVIMNYPPTGRGRNLGTESQ